MVFKHKLVSNMAVMCGVYEPRYKVCLETEAVLLSLFFAIRCTTPEQIYMGVTYEAIHEVDLWP
jgi:hypothetical protein